MLSANVHRRHMTAGARAMAVAKVVGPTTTQGRAAEAVGVSRTRVMQACAVLEHAPELADVVLAGGSLAIGAAQTIAWPDGDRSPCYRVRLSTAGPRE